MDEKEIAILKKSLRAMIRSRTFEEKTIELYQKGIIQGSLHPGIGHEAIPVGVCSALNDDDYLFPHHRGLGYFMFRGTDPKSIMAEWFGKKTGICGGKGGVTHAADNARHIFGLNGIVGGNLPIAMGLALAMKMREAKQVVVCFFGDGAVNQGSFHESANLASLWKVPLVYICENNQYAISASVEMSSAVPDLEKRTSAYGIPGIAVDGMDVLEVYKAASEAVSRARVGGGPSFLNCKTYRYFGHSMSDKRVYRTRKEEEEWTNRDPVRNTAERLIEAGVLGQKDVDKLEEDAKLEMEEAVRFAQESLPPTEEDLYKNVYFHSQKSGGDYA